MNNIVFDTKAKEFRMEIVLKEKAQELLQERPEAPYTKCSSCEENLNSAHVFLSARWNQSAIRLCSKCLKELFFELKREELK